MNYPYPIEPIRKTPWWVYLFGKPPYRQWVWEHVEGKASYGHWDYIRTPMLAYDDPEVWRETVRSLYDDLHFGPDNTFTGNRLAKRLIKYIEDRHPNFFSEDPKLRKQQ